MTDTQATPSLPAGAPESDSIAAGPHTEPSAPPPRPVRPARPEAAFFSWIRALGVPRTRGWLGGVCVGIAGRIGIDPLIVRGIFVVVAVIGFPALLVYAIAWALLPGLDGRIHVQELGRGRFDPAIIAIAIMTLVSFVPLAPWFWRVMAGPFTSYWDGGPFSGFVMLLNAALLIVAAAGVIALVIWLAVRASTHSRGGSVNEPRTASAAAPAPGSPFADPSVDAPTAASADAATHAAADPYALYRPAADTDTDAATRSLHHGDTSHHHRVGPAAVADAGGIPSPSLEPPAEPVLPPDAPADELAAWRASHEQWRAEHDAWRRQQAEAYAAAREQARAERDAAARAFAAEAAERRRVRRATNPRASAVFVLSVVGAALVAGAITALTVGDATIAAAAGLLVGAVVAAAGMVIAGIARRRSGFLAFVTILLVSLGVITGVTASTTTVMWGDAAVSSLSTTERSYLQPFGHTHIEIWDLGEDPFTPAPIVLRKGTGETTIYVQPGSAVRLDASLGDGTVDYERMSARTGETLTTGRVAPSSSNDAGRIYRRTFESPNADGEVTTVVPVRIGQAGGSIRVVIATTEQED